MNAVFSREFDKFNSFQYRYSLSRQLQSLRFTPYPGCRNDSYYTAALVSQTCSETLEVADSPSSVGPVSVEHTFLPQQLFMIHSNVNWRQALRTPG